MNKGCLIFAHDSDVDYGSQAVLSAKLAKKYLNVPVSLVSDQNTVTNLTSKFDTLPFDKIIEVEKPLNPNLRRLVTNKNNQKETKDFFNLNRSSAWSLTPYDRTLIIDSDFLIFSDRLSNYWSDPHEFLITPGMVDLQSDTTTYQVSAYTIDMLWATNIMFSKTDQTKILFDLVDYIRVEYLYFSQLYEFDREPFRNDYAFSIACHMLSSYGLEPWHGELPAPLWFKDTDSIIDIKDNQQITFLAQDKNDISNSYLIRAKDQDLHVMNKYSLLENLPRLLELIDE